MFAPPGATAIRYLFLSQLLLVNLQQGFVSLVRLLVLLRHLLLLLIASSNQIAFSVLVVVLLLLPMVVRLVHIVRRLRPTRPVAEVRSVVLAELTTAEAHVGNLADLRQLQHPLLAMLGVRIQSLLSLIQQLQLQLNFSLLPLQVALRQMLRRRWHRSNHVVVVVV